MYSQESNEQKNQHEQFGTQNRAAQLSLARRGQRHRWIGHSTVRRNSNPLNTSMKNQKRYKEKGTHTPKNKKAIKLTSHAASMDLMVEFSGNGVVPRERSGPIPQLLMRTASEQRAEQLMAHGQVVENLQHVYQDRNRHGK